jgi:ubiquitin C-terminal hydrolase
MKLNFILYMIAHPGIVYLMLSAIPPKYPHLAAVVQEAATSSGTPPLATVATGSVNVHSVIGKLSWFGFFKHLEILVEVGAHRNLFCAFFVEVFSWHGSRRVDIYTSILRSAEYQVDTTPPPGLRALKSETKPPQRIADLMARIGQNMSTSPHASPVAQPAPPNPPVPPNPGESAPPTEPPGEKPPIDTPPAPDKPPEPEASTEEQVNDDPPADKPPADQPPQVQRPTFVNPFAVEQANPFGIPNVGNSCYAGSLVRLMFQNKQFREAVAKLHVKIPQEETYPQKLLHSMYAIFMHMQSGTGVCPPKLMRNFMQIGEQLGYVKPGQQDDPTVLLMGVLDSFEKLFSEDASPEILTLKDALLPMVQEQRFIESLVADAGHRVVYAPSPNEVRHVIEISPNNKSLEAGLRQRYGSEELTGDNRYELDDGTKVDARISTKITAIPPTTLTVQIKRISFNPRGVKQKNNATCTFPERIDMREHMADPGEEPLEYELNGIIAHRGGPNGGHYISCVKRNGQWFKCDDSGVAPAQQSEIEALYNGRDGFYATMLSYARLEPIPTSAP